MTPERAYEIGQVAAIGKGRGGDSTRDVEEALASLWVRVNHARKVVEDLRDELEEREWTFEEGYWKGSGGIWCRGCGADGPAGSIPGDPNWPPKHKLTCAWKQTMDAANAFLGVEKNQDDTPQESLPGHRGQREDLPLDGQKHRG